MARHTPTPSSLLTFTGVVLFTGVLLGQQPVRDAAGKPSIDTGVIEGTVVADEPNGQPLRRVSLELVPGVAQRFTTTDADGRFVFAGLPPGRYFQLRASRAGFVGACHGQRRLGLPCPPIVLAEGQHLTVAIKMLRGAVITGTVLDQGRPAVQQAVTAVAVRMVKGQRVVDPGNDGRAITDERGAYRLSGLAPGDYVVSAAPQQPDNSELRTVTPEEIKWAQQQLQGSGSPTAGALPTRVPPPPKPAQAVAYSPVYYPGTTDMARAGAVTVLAGQERGGVDFSVRLVPTARIEGTVLDPDGQPARSPEITVSIAGESEAMADPFEAEMRRSLRPTVVNGTFTLTGVRPGRYSIAARGAARGTPAAMTLWARAEIVVEGIDQSGIQMRLEPGMTLSGRVSFEDITVPPPATQPRASVGLRTAPTASGGSLSINIPTVQAAPDGTFTIEGVPPGRYLLRPGSPVSRPPLWQVKSARVGDIEAADHPFEVRPSENVSGIAITLTNKTAEVSGTLVNAAGQPASDLTVLLFPTDRALWSSGSRRFPRSTTTGSDGKFRFANLLAGDWYVAAVSDFDGRDMYNSDFLSQVAAAAIKVPLADGEKKVQDLKILGRASRQLEFPAEIHKR